MIKDTVGELDNLLNILYNLKTSGSIQESMKSTFLECLKNYGSDFKSLYANQLNAFKKDFAVSTIKNCFCRWLKMSTLFMPPSFDLASSFNLVSSKYFLTNLELMPTYPP